MQKDERQLWQADVKLRIAKLAHACQYVEIGKGSQNRRHIVATDWLAEDGKTIQWDVGKRLQGWLKQEALSLGNATKRDAISYGVSCVSLPNAGYIPIGDVSMFAPSRTWQNFKDKAKYILNGLPEPEVENIQTKSATGKVTSVFCLFYVMKESIDIQARIYCAGQGLDSIYIEDWLRKLGPIFGLGDKHNSSSRYGRFEVLEYKLAEKVIIQY
ncbi:MAG: hypothetical protein KGN01_07515 [Patescibacteria group bacterium]|nr:hypothetical protein [Patescibacteria group bacterium]